MCIPTGSSSPKKVELEPIPALAGKGIKHEDPRFQANKQRKKRMNLRITKPKAA